LAKVSPVLFGDLAIEQLLVFQHYNHADHHLRSSIGPRQIIGTQKEKGSFRCLLIPAPNEVLLSGGLGAGVVLAAELLDTASGVHDLLCAGVERVALGADFDVQIRFAHGGAGLELVAAAARHCDLFVFRVYGGFHFVFLAKVGRGICTRTDTD
jgi:hypothetical protein